MIGKPLFCKSLFLHLSALLRIASLEMLIVLSLCRTKREGRLSCGHVVLLLSAMSSVFTHRSHRTNLTWKLWNIDMLRETTFRSPLLVWNRRNSRCRLFYCLLRGKFWFLVITSTFLGFKWRTWLFTLTFLTHWKCPFWLLSNPGHFVVFCLE